MSEYNPLERYKLDCPKCHKNDQVTIMNNHTHSWLYCFRCKHSYSKYCCKGLLESSLVYYEDIWKDHWVVRDNAQFHQEDEKIFYCPFCGTKLENPLE